MRVDKGSLRTAALASLSQQPQVSKAVRALAAQIRDDARRLAPVDDGRLRRGITVERSRDPRTGHVVYLVGWAPSAWYGWMVETGTQRSTPRPHLVPAAIRNGARGAGTP